MNITQKQFLNLINNNKKQYSKIQNLKLNQSNPNNIINNKNTRSFSIFNNNLKPKYLNLSIKTYFSSKKDLQETLGVNRNASESEIKAAQFKLAKQWHPDRNKAPDAKQKFSEITVAQETLVDGEKRKMQDQTGMTADDQGDMNYQNMDDINEMFKNMGFKFNQKDMDDVFGGFSSFFGEDFAFGNQPTRGKDIQTSISISFIEAIKGTTRSLRLNKPDVCNDCKGSKMEPGTRKLSCSQCRGTGRISFQQGPMIIQQTCQSCGGVGERIVSPCKSCKGSGFGSSATNVEVKVPAGISDGQTLRMGGKGQSGRNGGTSGDLLVKVGVSRDSLFEREGNNLIHTLEIDFILALVGGKIKVPTQDGSSKSVSIPSGSQSNEEVRLRGEGVPKLPPNQFQKGDYIIRLKVKLPKMKDLTDRQKELLHEFIKEDPKYKSGEQELNENVFESIYENLKKKIFN